MNILKNTKYLEIPRGYFPKLALSFASPGTIDTKVVGKDIANNYYKDRDFELLKDLYFFRFATFEQLCELLKIEESEESAFKNRLRQLLSRRVINKFSLSNEEKEKMVDDGSTLVCYCLDYTGVEVLTHKYSGNNIINFDVSMNLQDSSMVGKRLFVVDFYLKLLRALPKENVAMFDPCPEYPLQKVFEGNRAITTRFRPGFAFAVNKGNDVKCYIAELFTPEELGLDLSDELKYVNEYLEKTKIYMPSAPNDGKKSVPTLLVFGNNNENLPVIAQTMVSSAPNVSVFRLGSEESVKGNLSDSGAFFKLEGSNLKPVSMAVFKA